MDREKLAQGGLSLGHRQSWCKETLAIPLEEGEKVILLKRLCSFLGRHASIFTLAGSVRCLCLTETVSPHRVPVGSTPAMTGGQAMGERQQKKSDSRWQHKHLRVRTPPWKESEGCLFSGAAKGCPLWDSQAGEQKGEQTADHTAELGEGPQVISYQINLR